VFSRLFQPGNKFTFHLDLQSRAFLYIFIYTYIHLMLPAMNFTCKKEESCPRDRRKPLDHRGILSKTRCKINLLIKLVISTSNLKTSIFAIVFHKYCNIISRDFKKGTRRLYRELARKVTLLPRNEIFYGKSASSALPGGCFPKQ